MNKLQQVLNDKSKKLFWWNKNYFFVGTLTIVIINICIFAFANNWQWSSFPDGSSYPIDRILIAVFNSFSHANWQHALLNMLCFFIAGLYLERKTGSLGLILFVIASAFFASSAMAMADSSSIYVNGFSGVNYLIYGYIIIEYLFSFQKNKRNKFNTIFGAIVIALIYLAMCFNGGTTSFGFEWYPYDLISNLWHYSGFIAGIIFGLTIQISQLKARKEL